MNLSDEVDLEDYVSRPDKISAADIAAITQEAGMHAVRKNRQDQEPLALWPFSVLASFACDTLLDCFGFQVCHPSQGL